MVAFPFILQNKIIIIKSNINTYLTMYVTPTARDGGASSTSHSSLSNIVDGALSIPGIKVHAPGMIVNVNVGHHVDSGDPNP